MFLIFLAHLPKWIQVVLLYTVFPLFFFLRWAFQSTYGWLFLALCLYASSTYIGLPKPLSAGELALWFDDLSEGLKGTVAGTLVTVFGFVVAFNTATKNWQNQTVANLKVNLSGSLNKRIQEASSLATNANIYAKHLIQYHAALNEPLAEHDVNRILYLATNSTPKFIETRSRIVELNIQNQYLVSENNQILSTIGGAEQLVEKLIAHFEHVAEEIWFPIPFDLASFPDPRQAYLHQVDPIRCQRYVEAYENNYNSFNGLAGSLQSQLLEVVIPTRGSQLLKLLNNPASYLEGLELHANNRERSDNA